MSKHRASCFVLILLTCSLYAMRTMRTAAQSDKSTANQQNQTVPFLGCYELKLGRWWPWGYGEDTPFVTPPKSVRLLPERGTEGFEQYGFLLRAIPRKGKPADGRGGWSYWSVDSANRVYLMWNDGFTGVTLKLEKDGKDLHGWAHPHFDSPHFIPHTAHVVARRIGCESAPAEPNAH
jgi:hypothetical protein